MEYVANRLGLVFVKVNGPALGHDVTLARSGRGAERDRARRRSRSSTSRFEMGNNVMLYLDDIQHTHPELLQKFISLCDAQRRIEGVWNGQTRTYDLRGKKFCVVMAGNPYTESGEAFQIPDMLANRADTYNLGDMLGGKEELFALELPRERADLEPGARAARHARPGGRAQARAHGAGRGGPDRPSSRTATRRAELDEIVGGAAAPVARAATCCCR